MAGLFGDGDDRGMLPLMVGLGILGNQRYTRAPQNFWTGLGGAGQGLQQYLQYQQGAQRAEQKEQERALRLQMLQMQMSQAQAKAQQEAQANERLTALQESFDSGEIQDTPATRLQLSRMGVKPSDVFAAAQNRKPRELQIGRRRAYGTFNPETGGYDLVEGVGGPMDAPKRAGSGGTDKGQWGNSLTGRSYSVLDKGRRELAASGSLTPETSAQVQVAAHQLTVPQMRLDANGNLVQFQPTLPPVFEDVIRSATGLPTAKTQALPEQALEPGTTLPPPLGEDAEVLPRPSMMPPGMQVPSEAPAEAQRDPRTRMVPGGTLTILSEKDQKGGEGSPNMDRALGLVGEVADLLNEAEGEDDTVTGVIGTAKGMAAPFARQLGVPMSDRTEKLQKKLRTLQMIAAPLLANEKRLSNEERARVAALIGDIRPSMDDVALRNSLAELLQFFETIKSRK